MRRRRGRSLEVNMVIMITVILMYVDANRLHPKIGKGPLLTPPSNRE